MDFLIGLLLSASISAISLAAGSLSRSGAIAAVAVGSVVYAFGGLAWAVLLIAFFVTSSVLGRLRPLRRRHPAGHYWKGGRRDAGQVLGNGAIAALIALAAMRFPDSPVLWSAFAGSVAAVTADTWATEMGALSRTEPRLLTRLGRTVPPGTSGAISVLGTAGGALGAAVIAILFVWLSPGRANSEGGVIVAGAGVLGSLVDSLLGATVQCQFRCTAEGSLTEQHPVHSCGAPTVHARGWPWVNNDWVNLACAAAGALGAYAGLLVFGTASV